MIYKSQLVTARLAVRPVVASDAPLLVALFADPEVHRFVDDGQPLAADVAALVDGRAPPLDPVPFSAGRFG